MTAVVKAESLTKRFGEVMAVTDLSFVLEAGTITGFLGPNGAGKDGRRFGWSWAWRRRRAGGRRLFDGPYAELKHPALRIGAVLEATDFHPGRSGRNHLRTLGRAVDEQPATELIYLAIQRSERKWRQAYNWTGALRGLKIHFADRLPD